MSVISDSEKLGRERLLRRITKQNQDDLVNALLKGRERVENAMFKAARNGRFGTAQAIRDDVYVNLRNQYMKTNGDMDVWTKKAMDNAGSEFHKLVTSDLSIDGAKPDSFVQFKDKHFEEYFERINPLNAGRIALTNVEMNKQLSAMLDSDIRQMQNGVVQAFRDAKIAGMTSAERFDLIKTNMLKVAEDPESWKFIDASGKKWNQNNYFSMLNRTVSANVARDTYHDSLIDNDRDLVQIIGGISSNSAQACISYLNRIVSLTGNTPGYPTLADYEGEGGFHPNCVHFTAYVSPFTKQGKELMSEQKGDPKPEVKQPTPRPKVVAKPKT